MFPKFIDLSLSFISFVLLSSSILYLYLTALQCVPIIYYFSCQSSSSWIWWLLNSGLGWNCAGCSIWSMNLNPFPTTYHQCGFHFSVFSSQFIKCCQHHEGIWKCLRLLCIAEKKMSETRYLYHIAFDIVFGCLKDGKTMAVVFWSSWMCYQCQRTTKRTGHV